MLQFKIKMILIYVSERSGPIAKENLKKSAFIDFQWKVYRQEIDTKMLE